eukprot:Rhum_TRINITY_DN14583_c22_g1::Rhum_TRINITY_DN14583_c22_g1_i1::g.101367::m.101367
MDQARTQAQAQAAAAALSLSSSTSSPLPPAPASASVPMMLPPVVVLGADWTAQAEAGRAARPAAAAVAAPPASESDAEERPPLLAPLPPTADGAWVQALVPRLCEVLTCTASADEVGEWYDSIFAGHATFNVRGLPARSSAQIPYGGRVRGRSGLLEYRRLRSECFKGVSVTTQVACGGEKVGFVEVEVSGTVDRTHKTYTGVEVFRVAVQAETGLLTSVDIYCDSDALIEAFTREKRCSAQVPTVPFERPCKHNNWDNVRINRRGEVTLRCRHCQSQWRVKSEQVVRCPAFQCRRCNLGEACTSLHINPSKLSLADRAALFGDSVLERVPENVARCMIASRSRDGKASSPSAPTSPARSAAEAAAAAGAGAGAGAATAGAAKEEVEEEEEREEEEEETVPGATEPVAAAEAAANAPAAATAGAPPAEAPVLPAAAAEAAEAAAPPPPPAMASLARPPPMNRSSSATILLTASASEQLLSASAARRRRERRGSVLSLPPTPDGFMSTSG